MSPLPSRHGLLFCALLLSGCYGGEECTADLTNLGQHDTVKVFVSDQEMKGPDEPGARKRALDYVCSKSCLSRSENPAIDGKAFAKTCEAGCAAAVITCGRHREFGLGPPGDIRGL